MKLTTAHQGYLVYLFFGILIATTPFIKLALPLKYSDYNVAFYNTVKNAPEGGWVFSWNIVDYFKAVGGLKGVFEAYNKQALYDKKLKFFMVNVGTGHGQEQLSTYMLDFYNGFFGVPLNQAPLYGKQFVYLGYLPIPEEVAITSLAEDIYALKTTDYWGTPLKNMPMFQETGAIKSARDAYIVTSIHELGIMLFPEQRKIAIMDDSWISYGSAVYNARQISGFIGGMRGGAEYEAMTGYFGGSTLTMVQSFFSASFVVILVIVGSALYIYNRRKGG